MFFSIMICGLLWYLSAIGSAEPLSFLIFSQFGKGVLADEGEMVADFEYFFGYIMAVILKNKREDI